VLPGKSSLCETRPASHACQTNRAPHRGQRSQNSEGIQRSLNIQPANEPMEMKLFQDLALHSTFASFVHCKTRDVKLTFIKEMQHAEFPSCLRFSFTRNKLEKSRKPSSSACACLCHDWNGNRGNPRQS
jgi:hypothetical protein